MMRSFATALRRAGDPDRRRAAAGGLLLGSLGLLGGLWVLLPGGQPPVPRLAADEPEAATSSALLSGPNELVLPLPGEDEVRTETTLRHRRVGVEVLDATIVNSDQLAAELVPGDAGTRLVVTSSAVHQCDRYAGSVVVTSRHPDEPRDHLFVDVRFADCDGVTAVPAAPSSVNDTSRTWGDDGLAPWARRAPSASDNTTPQPDETEPTEDPEPTEPTDAPTTEPSPDPTPSGQPEPTEDPEPTDGPPSGGPPGSGGDDGDDD